MSHPAAEARSQPAEIDQFQGEIALSGIVRAVDEYYEFKPGQLFARDPGDSTVDNARGITLTLAAGHTALSIAEIADVAGRSQGAVRGAVANMRRRAEQDPKLSAHMEMLLRAAAGEPLPETLSTWSRLVEDHFHLPGDQITEPRDMRAKEARQLVAHLLKVNTVLEGKAIARRIGLTGTGVAEAVEAVSERRRKDELFDSRVAKLESGLLPEVITEAQIRNNVSAHYGISWEKFTAKGNNHYNQNRMMTVHLLVEQLGYSLAAASKLVGRQGMRTATLVEFEQRLADDPRLQAHKEALLNPSTAERPPLWQRVRKQVYDFYGVDTDDSVDDRSAIRFFRPREVTAYLLREQYGFSTQEVADQLGRGRTAIAAACRNIRNKIDTDPLVAAEVAYLKKPRRITRTINERIIMRVSEATGVDSEDILAGSTPEGVAARRLSISLMLERGHLSGPDIAKIFNISTQEAVHWAAIMIEKEQHNSSLLAAQMEWVRNNIFSEKSAEFIFNGDVPKELQDGQEIRLHGGLPEISEKLVHPEIVAQIYEIVEQTADFYGVSAVDIVGSVRDFTIDRARRVAIFRCRNARIPSKELGICFGSRRQQNINAITRRVRDDQEEQKILAEEIQALENGEARRDLINEMRVAVSRFYGIEPSELSTGTGHWVARARSAFLIVMEQYKATTYKQLAQAVGKSEASTDEGIHITRKRLEREPRLKAEILYLINPGEVPRPPDAKDVLKHLNKTLGISMKRLMQPATPGDWDLRRRAAYILDQEVEMPQKEIAELLGCNIPSIYHYVRFTRAQLANQPKTTLEIDEMLPPDAISLSTAGRIFRYIDERYHMQLEDLVSQDSSPELERVRGLTSELLINGGYSAEQAAQLLS